MTNGKRVLVAMSGGVDSSVTAFLLKQQGYDCEGVTMRLTCSRSFDDPGPRSCCSLRDIADAQAVCERIGIPYRVLDMRELFERRVVDKFVATYEDGRTPNPCIDCNRYMKFGALLDWALEHGFDFVATGHYARIESLDDVLARVDATGESAPRHAARDAEVDLLRRISQLSDDGAAAVRTLSIGVDDTKDQSYVLYSLTQERLARTLLPLGGLVKAGAGNPDAVHSGAARPDAARPSSARPDAASQASVHKTYPSPIMQGVREIAEEQGLVNAEKPDSQGICFVPDNDFAAYIERRENRLLPEGDVIDAQGNVLGRHQGAIRYTVGQRKGLGVAMLRPMYVTAVDADANTVTLGENEDLMASSLIADDWIWSAPADVMRSLLDEAAARSGGLPVSARIRYHQSSQTARLSWDYSSSLHHASSEGPDGVPNEELPGSEPRRLRLDFDAPQRAIAPGQAVVVYAAGVVLGGGTVRQSVPGA